MEACHQEGDGLVRAVEIKEREGAPSGTDRFDTLDGNCKRSLLRGGGEVVNRRPNGAFDLVPKDQDATAESNDDGLDGNDETYPEMDLKDGSTEPDSLGSMQP